MTGFNDGYESDSDVEIIAKKREIKSLAFSKFNLAWVKKGPDKKNLDKEKTKERTYDVSGENGYESEYQSGDEKYNPENGKEISGASARFRFLISESGQKRKAVLDPTVIKFYKQEFYLKDILNKMTEYKNNQALLNELEEIYEETFEEVIRKYNFIKALNPDKSISLFLKNKYGKELPFDENVDSFKFNKLDYILGKTPATYRLTLPEAPGKTFFDFTDNLKDFEFLLQIKLYKAALIALADCHEKGYCVIDFKGDNIFYDVGPGKATLIDGGQSARIGQSLPKKFQMEDAEQIEFCKDNFCHYAPECFDTVLPNATPDKDVYSLGYMMLQLIPRNKLNRNIADLIQSCLRIDPNKRPTTKELLEKLEILETKMTFSVSDSELNEETVRDIKETISILFKEYNSNYKAFFGTRNHKPIVREILNACKDKTSVSSIVTKIQDYLDKNEFNMDSSFYRRATVALSEIFKRTHADQSNLQASPV